MLRFIKTVTAGTILFYLLFNFILAPLLGLTPVTLTSAFGWMLFGTAITADAQFSNPREGG